MNNFSAKEKIEKLNNDIKKGKVIFRNFGENDKEFRKRVLEKTKEMKYG